MEHNQKGPTTRISLIQGMPAGDEQQWRNFVDRYTPLIRETGSKAGLKTAELDDLVQVVSISLHNAMCVRETFTYDPERGSFRGYVYVAAKRAAWAIQRRRRGHSLEIDIPAEVSNELENLEMQQRLYETLAALSEEATDTGRRDIEIFRKAVLLQQATSVLAKEYEISEGRVHGIKCEVSKLLRYRFARDWGNPLTGERN